ncbi:hypothetical protein BGZ76_008664 [Entomortierella beljakovae]|nr:hypothetical protein BGZ76_008664 [Entomortierella beljakovae]
MSSSEERKQPHVLIVGAGLAGLLLGLLLDRQNVSYEIFERSSTVRPLGAVMSLNPNILPALDQLGLLEELRSVSCCSQGMSIYDGDLKVISDIRGDDDNYDLLGYEYLLFSRPYLYQIFLKNIASEKIHYSKKVTSITQDDSSASITCSDGTTYRGDIIVGADGTYSEVRQNLYAQLQKENKLPISDTQSLNKGFICLVGTTNPLDPAQYKNLDDKYGLLHQIIGKNNHFVWSGVNVPGNRICWNAVQHLSAKEEDTLQNAEWGPSANEEMIKEVRDFKMPFGGSLGDLIDATPKDTISRVFFEDKIFQTWAHNRVVLIGDACHKLLPSAGQGAVNAMQDSVILANCIYEMASLSTKDINAAMQDYREQRFPHVMEQYNASNMAAKIIFGQSFFDRLVRNVVLNYLPRSAVHRNLAKNHAYRPQASYIPQIPKKGRSPVLPQKPSKRYQKEQEAKASTV